MTVATSVASLTPNRAAPDRPTGMPRIHHRLHQAGLPLETYRTFCYLAYEAKLIIGKDGQRRWAAICSLNEIAEGFRGSYPNSQIEVLRRKASDSIKDLEARGMLLKEQRSEPGKPTLSNIYYILPVENWKLVAENSFNVRRGRTLKKSSPDPGRITPPASNNTPPILGGSGDDEVQEGDPPRITLEEVFSGAQLFNACQQSVTAIQSSFSLNTPPILGGSPPRSSEDHHIYREYLNTPLDDLRERERENFAQKEIKDPEQELTANKELGESAAAPSQANAGKDFDWENYNWAEFSGAGAGGSDLRFFSYAQNKVEEYNRRQKTSGNPGVGDLEAYTLGMIRKQGKARYQAFLKSIDTIDKQLSDDSGERSQPWMQSGKLRQDYLAYLAKFYLPNMPGYQDTRWSVRLAEDWALTKEPHRVRIAWESFEEHLSKDANIEQGGLPQGHLTTEELCQQAWERQNRQQIFGYLQGRILDDRNSNEAARLCQAHPEWGITVTPTGLLEYASLGIT